MQHSGRNDQNAVDTQQSCTQAAEDASAGHDSDEPVEGADTSWSPPPEQREHAPEDAPLTMPSGNSAATCHQFAPLTLMLMATPPVVTRVVAPADPAARMATVFLEAALLALVARTILATTITPPRARGCTQSPSPLIRKP